MRPANWLRRRSGIESICCCPRGSNHANPGATATPPRSTSIPVSPIPEIATASTTGVAAGEEGAELAAADCSRSARVARRSSASISVVPPGPPRHGVGRWRTSSSVPSSSATRTFTPVLPRSSPATRRPLTPSARHRPRTTDEGPAGGSPPSPPSRKWVAATRHAALTARTGQSASRRTRCATLPVMSLPTGVRRRRPMTMRSATWSETPRENGLGRVVIEVELPDLVDDAGRLEPLRQGVDAALRRDGFR